MLYIVTPIFNRKEFTQNYLLALQKQTDKNFKVIIVDDGSTDGSSQMIGDEFPEVILLKEKGDLWWAEATNIGVKHAIKLGANYVMTLNDDTLPEPDYIEKMIYWSKKYPTALLGAFAIDAYSKKHVFGGEILNWKTAKYEDVLTSVSEEEHFGLKEVNIFPGRGLLIPIQVFKNIGYYDSKNFPQTVADLDFTMRAYNYGYKIYCNYDAKIAIYTEESGGVKLVQDKNWKNYYQHLFGMRGAANLKWFTIFTLKNAPKKYLIQYLIRGILKRVIKYPFEWIKA